ncbi:hypothetical protein BCV71DRAFT_53535 [Rhizopus microsporus]|uniref:Uncharacterized protein n=1 Tax=Rhizopus microsporus TaxID=58291 RepID=A0A1X0RQR6_RHIZD|nr:hypothetical protein BCV71DRAFT_53535 [Rhizopus microsporus]
MYKHIFIHLYILCLQVGISKASCLSLSMAKICLRFLLFFADLYALFLNGFFSINKLNGPK